MRTACFALLFLFAGYYFLVLAKPDYPRSWHDHQRLMQLAGLTLSAVLLPFSFFVAPARALRAGGALSVVLLVVLIIHGTESRAAVIESLTLALLVVSTVWWAGLIQKYRLSDALLIAAQLSIAWYVAVSVLWLLLSLSYGTPPNPLTFFEGFINPRFFGAWVTLTWPLLLLRPRGLVSEDVVIRKSLSCALFVIAALWWALAIFSATRATWLTVFAVLVLTALCSADARRFALRGALVVLAGYILHHLLFIVLPSTLFGLEPLNALDRLRGVMTLSRREVLWEIALRGIAERPWLGAGPMMFAATNNGIASTVHNITLQFAYEWGIPFTVALVLATVRGMRNQFVRCRNDPDPTRLALWMCIAGGLIQGQIDSLLNAPHSQIVFLALCAWLISLDPLAADDATATQMRVWRIVRFIPLLLVCALWWVVRPELSRLEAWERETWEQTAAPHYQPRYWFQGVILNRGW